MDVGPLTVLNCEEPMLDSIAGLNLNQLSVSQKLDLIGAIWDSIPSADALPIPDWHRELLEQRLAAADADPEATVPWEQVRERLRRQP